MSMRRHILVVEDYEGVREVIEDILANHGYRVTCAANGQEMRAVIGGETVDLILLDVGLPGEPSGSLAAYGKARKIPVLLMSAHPEKLRELRGEGIRCLRKPFRIRTLVRAVETAISAGPGDGSAADSPECSSECE